MQERPDADSPDHVHPSLSPKQLAVVSLSALGVVFGDIGTSPLYAFKECLNGPHGVAPTHENVLGVLSLILWSITLVVTVKYLVFIMRADNRGEGGIFALLALLPRQPTTVGSRADEPRASTRRRSGVVVLLGIIGAGLLYGDGIITPAISVLSAVEGLTVATPALAPAVLPITCVTLLGLFALQRRGTARVGALFGPVMLAWFVTIAVLGSIEIVHNPAVLSAISPHHAYLYFAEHGLHGGVILGAVVLSVTGGEALYADMGHFGVRPIRAAWYCVALPSLVLAYLGQGALVLRDPSAVAHPFFVMVPPGIPTYALVALASMATVIASQALISGVFSLTKQAVQLGFLPRLEIRHTAGDAEGQIYLPTVNWALAIACIAVVLSFRESSRLAAAYGIAVSGTMAITSIVYYEVVRLHYRWPTWRALPLLIAFLALDLPFLAANAIKVLDGGYVPLLIGGVLVVLMVTWRSGRRLLAEQLQERADHLRDFVCETMPTLQTRVRGTAVFMTSNAELVPPAMHRAVQAIPVLQEIVLVLSIRFAHRPRVKHHERLQIKLLGCGVLQVQVRYGFMEEPDLPSIVLDVGRHEGLDIDLETTTYYVQRERFLASSEGKMGRLSEELFSVMARNVRPADAYFRIPPDRVIEVGAQYDL